MHGTPRGGGGSWRLELEGPNQGWPGLGGGHLWGIGGGKDGRAVGIAAPWWVCTQKGNLSIL